MIFFEIVIALETTSNEFCVVYYSVSVGIHDVQDFVDISTGELAIWDVLDAFLELFNGQLAVSVLVELGKDLSQLRDLVLRNS
jgi:hypothetical protein